MSRFRRQDKSATRDMLLESQRTTQTDVVPVTAQQHAQVIRKRVMIGGAVVAAAVLLILAAWYFSSKPAEAKNYLADARQHFEMGKYSDALGELNLAVRQSDHRTEAYRLRVATYRALDRPRDAYEDLSRLIKLEPDVAEHYRSRAQLTVGFGDFRKAMEDYNVLIDRHKDPSAYTGRAACYLKIGDVNRAIADLSESIRLSPGVENYLQRGLAYASLSDYGKAAADYNQAIAINPGAGPAYRARAYARGVLGDAAGSQQDTKMAMRIESPEEQMESKFPER